MSDFDLNKLAELVKLLKSEVKDSFDVKGLLYYAIKIAANACKIIADDFLKSENILSTASLPDDKTKLNKLGFPRDFTGIVKQPTKSGAISFLTGPTFNEETYILLIVAALVIVSNIPHGGKLVEKVDKSVVQERIKTLPIVKPPEPVSENLTLALVLKGKELENIKTQIELSLGMAIKFLEKAGYFSCISQKEMNTIQNELSTDGGKIDRESEQQVFVSIHFEHSSPLPKSKTFASKLELTQYLKKGSNGFKVDTIQTLTKVSGLGKLGFIRT